MTGFDYLSSKGTGSPLANLLLIGTIRSRLNASIRYRCWSSVFPNDEKSELKTRLLELVRTELPTVAKRKQYPIRFDHCFLRVIYDNLFDAPWRTVLHENRAAIYQLTEVQLKQAIALAENMLEDRECCVQLNQKSLLLRGKRKVASQR